MTQFLLSLSGEPRGTHMRVAVGVVRHIQTGHEVVAHVGAHGVLGAGEALTLQVVAEVCQRRKR